MSRLRDVQKFPVGRGLTVCVVVVAVMAIGWLLQAGASRSSSSVELTISAASSLAGVLTEAGQAYEEKHPGVKLHFQFGGSGGLAEQIRHGAPVDLLLSASRYQVDELMAHGELDESSHRLFIANSLVVVVPKASPVQQMDWPDLLHINLDTIAVGQPGVPARDYIRQSEPLKAVWEKLAPQAVWTKSVHQALTYAETEQVDAAIVYATDAMRSEHVRVVCHLSPSLYASIHYAGAVTRDSRHPREAIRFLMYLTSEAGQQHFRRYGFNAVDTGTDANRLSGQARLDGGEEG
ncbi:molybdate ABC transporter substrate-binding protein [Marinicrinis sediminis]|uniref:Molybdate ABC transporter substrate-binding protein n=1 Tax=Marinicrinis sediminis TaxID=1652465 RepID=A0ABW5R5Q3_9BACL